MRTYKWIYLILVSSVLISCSKSSEEELIGDWQKRATFPEYQRAYAATFVIGNEGYVVGGTLGTKALLNDAYAFDHTGGGRDKRTGKSTGTWRQVKDFPGRARQQAVGFSLKVNGQSYGFVGAGWSYDADNEDEIRRDFWRYDPANDSWEEVAPLPDNAKARRAAIAFSLKIGDTEYAYVGCGFTIDENRPSFLLDFWRYDPVNNEWTPELGYGGNKRAGAAAFVIENRAYICTGENTTGPGSVVDFWMFDPSSGEKWTNLRTMANANPDEDYDDDYGGLARSFGVAYVAQVGGELRGHIVGGRNSTNYQNWEYDHNEDLWTQRTKFINNAGTTSSREGMVAFSFPETQRAYIGMGKASGSTSTTSIYDDMWEFVPLEDDYTYDDLF